MLMAVMDTRSRCFGQWPDGRDLTVSKKFTFTRFYRPGDGWLPGHLARSSPALRSLGGLHRIVRALRSASDALLRLVPAVRALCAPFQPGARAERSLNCQLLMLSSLR